METSTMIRQLRRTAKKHENDKLLTFATNITAMCTDVANRLEELENEKKEIRAKTIDEFAEALVKHTHKIPSRCLGGANVLEIAEKMKGE